MMMMMMTLPTLKACNSFYMQYKFKVNFLNENSHFNPCCSEGGGEIFPTDSFGS